LVLEKRTDPKFGEFGADLIPTCRRKIEFQVPVEKTDANVLMHIYLYILEIATMASMKVSVAEARQHFARLIKRAQQGKAIEITRRGEPVAVLVSAAEYSAITGERPSFVDATRQVRERLGVDALEIGDADFEGLREQSPGRDVSL
jgi:prevent-host-death family protein